MTALPPTSLRRARLVSLFRKSKWSQCPLTASARNNVSPGAFCLAAVYRAVTAIRAESSRIQEKMAQSFVFRTCYGRGYPHYQPSPFRPNRQNRVRVFRRPGSSSKFRVPLLQRHHHGNCNAKIANTLSWMIECRSKCTPLYAGEQKLC